MTPRSVHCEQCGRLRIWTDRGYISGCDHYPPDIPEHKLTRRERCAVGSVRYYEDKCAMVAGRRR